MSTVLAQGKNAAVALLIALSFVAGPVGGALAQKAPATAPELGDGKAKGERPTAVASERSGVVLFVAAEFKPGDKVPTGKDLERQIAAGKIYSYEVSFPALQVGDKEAVAEGEKVVVLGPDGKPDGKRYRRWREGDKPEAGRFKLVQETRLFRKLKVGDRVQKGDLLALINPALALDDVLVKAARLEAAEAEMLASMKTRDEAERRYYRDRGLRAAGATKISEDDLRASELAWQRCAEEVKARTAAVAVAQLDVHRALKILHQYEIRSPAAGVVESIDKLPGEGVKRLDSVLRLRTTDEP
jgi:multidrug efflux pump subunit AcrA (membrane-fusion protein)